MQEKNVLDFLSHNIYLTRGWDDNFARQVVLQEEEQTDAITGKTVTCVTDCVPVSQTVSQCHKKCPISNCCH